MMIIVYAQENTFTLYSLNLTFYKRLTNLASHVGFLVVSAAMPITICLDILGHVADLHTVA